MRLRREPLELNWKHIQEEISRINKVRRKWDLTSSTKLYVKLIRSENCTCKIFPPVEIYDERHVCIVLWMQHTVRTAKLIAYNNLTVRNGSLKRLYQCWHVRISRFTFRSCRSQGISNLKKTLEATVMFFLCFVLFCLLLCFCNSCIFDTKIKGNYGEFEGFFLAFRVKTYPRFTASCPEQHHRAFWPTSHRFFEKTKFPNVKKLTAEWLGSS